MSRFHCAGNNELVSSQFFHRRDAIHGQLTHFRDSVEVQVMLIGPFRCRMRFFAERERRKFCDRGRNAYQKEINAIT